MAFVQQSINGFTINYSRFVKYYCEDEHHLCLLVVLSVPSRYLRLREEELLLLLLSTSFVSLTEAVFESSSFSLAGASLDLLALVDALGELKSTLANTALPVAFSAATWSFVEATALADFV